MTNNQTGAKQSEKIQQYPERLAGEWSGMEETCRLQMTRWQ